MFTSLIFVQNTHLGQCHRLLSAEKWLITNATLQTQKMKMVFYFVNPFMFCQCKKAYSVNPKGNVDNPKGNVDNSKGNVDNSKGNVDNSKGNVDNSKGNVVNPKGNVDNSKGNVDNSKENVDNSKGNVDNSKGNVDNSKGCNYCFTKVNGSTNGR